MSAKQIFLSVAACILSYGLQNPAHAGNVSMPEIPNALKVPSGYHQVAKAQARGMQIYKAAKSANGELTWILDRPIATLVDESGKSIYHYAGPSWQAPDGSAISRDTRASLISTPAKDPKHNIGWLLVKVAPKADSKPTNGIFAKVEYIQRLSTEGGMAPESNPLRADSEVGVPYSAVYAFYARD
jgi:hypothetical protein